MTKPLAGNLNREYKTLAGDPNRKYKPLAGDLNRRNDEQFPFLQKVVGDGACYFNAAMTGILHRCVTNDFVWQCFCKNLSELSLSLSLEGDDCKNAQNAANALLGALSPKGEDGKRPQPTREVVNEILLEDIENNLVTQFAKAVLIPQHRNFSQFLATKIDYIQNKTNLLLLRQKQENNTLTADEKVELEKLERELQSYTIPLKSLNEAHTGHFAGSYPETLLGPITQGFIKYKNKGLDDHPFLINSLDKNFDPEEVEVLLSESPDDIFLYNSDGESHFDLLLHRTDPFAIEMQYFSSYAEENITEEKVSNIAVDIKDGDIFVREGVIHEYDQDTQSFIGLESPAEVLESNDQKNSTENVANPAFYRTFPSLDAINQTIAEHRNLENFSKSELYNSRYDFINRVLEKEEEGFLSPLIQEIDKLLLEKIDAICNDNSPKSDNNETSQGDEQKIESRDLTLLLVYCDYANYEKALLKADDSVFKDECLKFFNYPKYSARDDNYKNRLQKLKTELQNRIKNKTSINADYLCLLYDFNEINLLAEIIQDAEKVTETELDSFFEKIAFKGNRESFLQQIKPRGNGDNPFQQDVLKKTINEILPLMAEEPYIPIDVEDGDIFVCADGIYEYRNGLLEQLSSVVLELNDQVNSESNRGALVVLNVNQTNTEGQNLKNLSKSQLHNLNANLIGRFFEAKELEELEPLIKKIEKLLLEKIDAICNDNSPKSDNNETSQGDEQKIESRDLTLLLVCNDYANYEKALLKADDSVFKDECLKFFNYSKYAALDDNYNNRLQKLKTELQNRIQSKTSVNADYLCLLYDFNEINLLAEVIRNTEKVTESDKKSFLQEIGHEGDINSFLQEIGHEGDLEKEGDDHSVDSLADLSNRLPPQGIPVVEEDDAAQQEGQTGTGQASRAPTPEGTQVPPVTPETPKTPAGRAPTPKDIPVTTQGTPQVTPETLETLEAPASRAPTPEGTQVTHQVTPETPKTLETPAGGAQIPEGTQVTPVTPKTLETPASRAPTPKDIPVTTQGTTQVPPRVTPQGIPVVAGNDATQQEVQTRTGQAGVDQNPEGTQVPPQVPPRVTPQGIPVVAGNDATQQEVQTRTGQASGNQIPVNLATLLASRKGTKKGWKITKEASNTTEDPNTTEAPNTTIEIISVTPAISNQSNIWLNEEVRGNKFKVEAKKGFKDWLGNLIASTDQSFQVTHFKTPIQEKLTTCFLTILEKCRKECEIEDEQVLKIIQEAVAKGGVSHSANNKTKGSLTYDDSNKFEKIDGNNVDFKIAKKFSALFQDECAKFGIYTGRNNPKNHVGLRLTFIPDDVVGAFKALQNQTPQDRNKNFLSLEEQEKIKNDVKGLGLETSSLGQSR